MITLFRKIATFHGPGRSSHLDSAGRSSITAPIDQMSASRKHTVGGYAFEISPGTSVPSRLFE